MNTQDEQVQLQAPLRKHWTRRTHRVLGVSSMLFLVLISISGLILNHADALGMSRHAAAPWLLRIYADELPPVDSAFVATGTLFATAAETLYADGEELTRSAGRLIGAVAIEDGYVVATSDALFLTDSNAVLIEAFAPDAPGPMSELGTDGRRIIVAIQGVYFEFDPQRMSLDSPAGIEMQHVAWSQPATPSADQAKQIGAAALGQAINWERVLLDFHSGRILPGVGRYLADITALCLLYMCFTGLWIWGRRR